MIKMVKCEWCGCTNQYRKEYMCDTDADFADLPPSGVMSKAYSPSGAICIVNASGEWVPFGAGGGEQVHVDPETGEILDSWDQIIAAVNDGTYSTKYAVGNYKPLDLGNEGIVAMQIAAFDADALSDESGNAHITWIAGTLLANRHIMNDGATNENGWAVCDMRDYLANDIWALIPSNVQNSIVQVYKSYYDYTTGSTQYCADKLWLPSYREVGIGVDAEEYGAIYGELFTGSDSLIRTLDGTPQYWWLRSASHKGSEYFYAISDSGGYSRYYANSTYFILLGFCM